MYNTLVLHEVKCNGCDMGIMCMSGCLIARHVALSASWVLVQLVSLFRSTMCYTGAQCSTHSCQKHCQHCKACAFGTVHQVCICAAHTQCNVDLANPMAEETTQIDPHQQQCVQLSELKMLHSSQGPSHCSCKALHLLCMLQHTCSNFALMYVHSAAVLHR